MDTSPRHRGCGSWPSPLTPAVAAAASQSLHFAGASRGVLFWIESRPQENGRSVLMTRRASGEIIDVLDRGENVRSSVHEYGGTPWVAAGDSLVYPHFGDQRLRVRGPDGSISVLTPSGCRYADGRASPDGRLLVCIREDHRPPGEARNTVVLLRLERRFDEGQVLFSGSDFVAAPRLSPDGRQLAFITWDHPAMPWDQTRLRIGNLVGDLLAEVRTIAGGAQESVIEPQWGPDGSLFFLSDLSGWWNLYRWRDGRIEALTTLEAEIGGPLWELGAQSYVLTGDGRVLLRLSRGAVDHLALLDLAAGDLRVLDLPFVGFESLGMLDERRAFAIATSSDEPEALVLVDLKDDSYEVLRRAGVAPLPPSHIARAEAIEFPTAPGPSGELFTAHAWFYPPHSPSWRPLQGEVPPLMLMMHGGPTWRASPAFSVAVQFWTSRGFAVAHVNYGGSSGFGRAFRERLNGQWGVIDLQDAVACVDALVRAGRVDAARVAIRGASAGGFAVLSALVFSDRFAAGINYFGVSDLQTLAADTHKFESHYLDGLVGPLPDSSAIYRARSPAHHMKRCRGALIMFQGSDDRAVPPQQSRELLAAAQAAGCRVAYVEFDGEGHGFRQEAHIIQAMNDELAFLGQVLGFESDGDLAGLPVGHAVDPETSSGSLEAEKEKHGPKA